MLNLHKGRGYQPTQKMKVEPMTLKALVRERIEAGKEMPTEIFGVFSENKTTIKGTSNNEPSSNKKRRSIIYKSI